MAGVRVAVEKHSGFVTASLPCLCFFTDLVLKRRENCMDEGQLWKLLDSLQAQIRAFDTKAQVALGLDSLMAGLMGTEIVRAVDLSSWHIDGSTAWFCAFAGSSVISLLVSVVFAIRTALPRLHLKQLRSHFFFCHLVELYGRRFGEAAKSLIALSDKQMVQELATQVQANAIICDAKSSGSRAALRMIQHQPSMERLHRIIAPERMAANDSSDANSQERT
jgi:hypothetical protein